MSIKVTTKGKVSKSTLGYLGEDFQYRLVSLFLKDGNYFKYLERIIDQNKFTIPELVTITGILKDYYHEYDSVPSFDLLTIKLREKIRTEEQIQLYNEVVEKLKNMTSEGVDYVREMGGMFFMQQHYIWLANEIKKLCGDGELDKFEECKAMIEGASAFSTGDPVLVTPLSDIDGLLAPNAKIRIPTGIPSLDEALNGGVAKGNMVLAIAPSGIGKTSLTTGISAAAATYKCENNDNQGYKVLQIVFEDSESDIERKYAGRISQIETSEFDNEDKAEEVKRMLTVDNKEETEMINRNIRIVRLPTDEYTATDICNYIKRKINEGFYPDMVIVDYLDCLLPERGTGNLKTHEQQNKTMRKFENTCKELNIALWLPTQSNREGFDSDDINMKHIQGSVGRGQIAHIVIGISRKDDDIKNNIAKLKLIKNRGGMAGLEINVYFNNGTSTIRPAFGSLDDTSNEFGF